MSDNQQVHITNVDPAMQADFAWFCRRKGVTTSWMMGSLMYLAVTNGEIMQQAVTLAPSMADVRTISGHMVAHHVPRGTWQLFRAQAKQYGSTPQLLAKGLLALFAEDSERLLGMMTWRGVA